MTDEQQVSIVPEKEEKTWGMLCHLMALTGYFIPFGNIIGPLVIWLIKKDDMPFVADQGKESLNFQLTILLAFIVSGILTFVLIGIFMIFVVALYDVVMVIVATVKSNDGVAYRYPYTIRFIK